MADVGKRGTGPAPSGTGSLHARIIEALRQNIVGGAWPPGFHLPRETDLAKAHAVSRMTMNKVLTQLAQEGYLVRRKRSGTFVARSRAQSTVMEINDIAEEVGQLGLGHGWTLLAQELRMPDEADRLLLGLTEAQCGRAVLALTGLHLAAGAPFCLERRVIDPAVVPGALVQNFGLVVPGQWLFHTMPFSTASHRIRAVGAVAGEARLLGLPVGAACLEVLRRTRIDHDWVTHVRLLYPGESHQLIAEFAPSPAVFVPG